jgi:hypothetical protein
LAVVADLDLHAGAVGGFAAEQKAGRLHADGKRRGNEHARDGSAGFDCEFGGGPGDVHGEGRGDGRVGERELLECVETGSRLINGVMNG